MCVYYVVLIFFTYFVVKNEGIKATFVEIKIVSAFESLQDYFICIFFYASLPK